MSPLVIGIGALLLGVQLLVVWPLLRRPRADAGDGDEARAVRLYRQQLAEIERGCADGLIDAGEAEALWPEAFRESPAQPAVLTDLGGGHLVRMQPIAERAAGGMR